MPRLSRLSLAVATLLTATSALAQDANKEARTLDTLIVTGTRVTDRTVAESQSPIDIITPETLQATGTTELATALGGASAQQFRNHVRALEFDQALSLLPAART